MGRDIEIGANSCLSLAETQMAAVFAAFSGLSTAARSWRCNSSHPGARQSEGRRCKMKDGVSLDRFQAHCKRDVSRQGQHAIS